MGVDLFKQKVQLKILSFDRLLDNETIQKKFVRVIYNNYFEIDLIVSQIKFWYKVD